VAANNLIAGLALAAAAVPRGVVCLISALSFHSIGTQLPYQKSLQRDCLPLFVLDMLFGQDLRLNCNSINWRGLRFSLPGPHYSRRKTMKRSGALVAVVFFLGLVFMPLRSTVAQDEITASQFKGLIALLSHVDHGKSTLVAVQGNRTIEVREFALMKQISTSGIKTTFYLRNDQTGSKKQIAVYEPAETGKSLGRAFWGMVCTSAGACKGCTELFGENPCK
jgi:hypothetical protein